MPCPCPAIPSPVVALAGWCPLSTAGIKTTQLLVEPSWTPAVLWDRVTLTCQGSGTASATIWCKGGQLWWQKGPECFVVNKSGTYTCGRPGKRLVLQLPTQAPLEGDTVTLCGRGWQDGTATGVRFYHRDKDLGRLFCGTELSLSPLQLHHSGHYHCRGWVNSGPSPCWENPSLGSPHPSLSHPTSLPSLLCPTSCPSFLLTSTPFLPRSTSPLTGSTPHMFHPPMSPVPPVSPSRGPTLGGVPVGAGPRGTGGTGGPPGTELCGGHGDRSPVLLLAPIWRGGALGTMTGATTSGNNVAKSIPLNVTILGERDPQAGMPVANATITLGPPALQVCPGDPVTLRCSVQVGSAPVTFTWLCDGQEVALGPLLELGTVDVGHSGTYQCVATNQLGQDGHRMFRALSPELTLEVTL
ncbi:hypothetical protein Nmel_014270 [Mimus melanotis]